MTEMTATQEALQKALDALNAMQMEARARNCGLKICDDAITTIKDALAEPKQELVRGWTEAAIAWNVCASIHREYAKGKDGLFTKRQADFVKHHEDARAKALAEPIPESAAEPESVEEVMSASSTPEDLLSEQARRIELLEALLQRAVNHIIVSEMTIEWEWGSCRTRAEMEASKGWPDLVHDIRKALP